MIHQKLDRQGVDVGSMESKSSLKKKARTLPLDTHFIESGSNYSTRTAGRVLEFMANIVAGMKIKSVFTMLDKHNNPASYKRNLPTGKLLT